MAILPLYQKDFWLRISVSLVLALFFIFLGSNSILDIVKGEYFFADFGATFLLVFIVTTWISLLSGYFNRHYQWDRLFITRLLYQLVAGVAIPSAFVFAYMSVYLLVILGFQRSEVPFFNTEFPIAVLFIIFWNALYAGYYFFAESRVAKQAIVSLRQQLFTLQNVHTSDGIMPLMEEDDIANNDNNEEKTFSDDPSPKIKILVAVSGNKNIPIPVENIAYFFKENNYTTLKTLQAETYLLNHTLEELMKVLDDALFFRANRQYIINLKACHYFTNEENGKLSLHLNPAVEDEVTISQKKATAFREWLNK